MGSGPINLLDGRFLIESDSFLGISALVVERFWDLVRWIFIIGIQLFFYLLGAVSQTVCAESKHFFGITNRSRLKFEINLEGVR